MTTIDPKLIEFATVRQIEYIDAIKKYGSRQRASKELGVARGSIQHALRSLNRKAALNGYSPKHDMTHTVPDGFKVKGVSTYYNEEGKPTGQWVKSAIDQERQEEILREFADSLCQDIKPLSVLPITPKNCSDDLLCIIPMGDPHFGMHAWWADAGEDFDLKLADKLTCAAVDRLIASSPNASTAILLNLGDMFHSDNQTNQSKSGHQLDVDGRWAKVQQVGLNSMIYCLRRMLEKYQKVVFRINRGNHDGHSAYALALMISCFFQNEPRMEVDLSPATCWYYQFGKVALGSTHGDTIKGPDMPSIMAADMPEMWGTTKHRYFFAGHIHHEDKKEYRGCVVEYFRTMAARDAWHAGMGYRAGRDMRLIVMHKEHGEIERHRADVGMFAT